MKYHALNPIRHLRGAFSALAVLGSLLTVNGQAATNLITNGNFEASVLPTGTYNQSAGSTGIPGWTVGGTNIQIVSAGYSWLWTGNNTQWVDLTGDSVSGGGYIEQTLTTSPGKVYRASIRTFNGSASFSYASFGSSSTPFSVTATGNSPMYATVTPGTEATVVYQFTAARAC